MDLSRIENLVGPVIFQKGEIAYKKGKIENYSFFDNQIKAEVIDIGKKAYHVEIKFRNGQVAQAHCTCLYFSLCKHIAAVLIHNRVNGKKIRKELTNPLNDNQNVTTKEKVFPLDFKTRITNDLNNLIESVNENPYEKNLYYNKFIQQIDSKNESDEKWNLVFIIKQAVDGPYQLNESGWEIAPAMQYIKMDGSPGRVEKYRNVHSLNEYTEQEEWLLRNLLEYNDKKADVKYFFDWIIDHPDVNIYLNNAENMIPVKMITIHEIRIQFKISTFASSELLFMPFLEFQDQDGNKYSNKDQEVTCIKTAFHVCLVFCDGFVLYQDMPDKIYRFIAKIFTGIYQFTTNDINQLKIFCDEQFTNNLSVDFQAKKIRMIESVPTPVLEVWEAESSKMLDIRILFDYGGKEVSLKDSDDLFSIDDNGDEIVIGKRDRKLESSIKNYLEYKFNDFSANNNSYYGSENCDYSFNEWIHSFVIKYGSVLLDEGFEIRLHGDKNRLKKGGGKIGVTVSNNIDWFDMNIHYTHENGDKQAIELDMEFVKKGLLKLKNSFVLLSYEEIEKIKMLVDEGMNDRGDLTVSKLNFNIIDQLYQNIENNTDKQIQDVLELHKILNDFTRIKSKSLPRGFQGNLRDYQKAGYNWLHFLRDYNLKGCLADDMGLGKTVQTLAFLQKLKEKKQLSSSLLVAPVTTLANWESEIKRFTPGINYLRHTGQNRKKDKELVLQYDLIIISYHTLRNDIDFFKDLELDYVILDESQAIKNAGSLIFKSVRLLNCRHRLSLTGTPIENNTMELWAQMQFLNPGLLGSKKQFKFRFAKPIESDKDRDKAEKLKKIVFPFILRRKKQDVLDDLPDKEEIILYSEMEESQQNVYNQLREYYRLKIAGTLDKKGLEKSAIEIFDALLRLRQAALFPELVNEEYKQAGSCKFDSLKEMIDEVVEENHKVLIFSQFVKTLKIIETYIKFRKLRYSYIDGSVKDRSLQIQQFQEQESVRVFLLSLKAGGVGINLTAADYVILFDPWWNPAVETQAVDRSHRIGQTKKVIVYKMITKDTVEEKILALQDKKKELVNNLITEEASFFKSLSKQDILDIFS